MHTENNGLQEIQSILDSTAEKARYVSEEGEADIFHDALMHIADVLGLEFI